MIDDVVVIDATVHGYNLAADNYQSARAVKFGDVLYGVLHESLTPRAEPQWLLSKEQFLRRATPDMLASCLFDESPIDFACYHAPGMFGLFKDGGSPISTGRAVAELAPDRLAFYGAVRPFAGDVILDEIDQQIEEHGIIGLKCYPNDMWDGKLRPFRLDDEELAFPIFQHALDRGLKSVAIHKSFSIGPVPMSHFRVEDVQGAAAAFRRLNFEVVHGGWAFVEETAYLLAAYPNVWVNLEQTSALLCNSPRRFAHVIGALLAAGGADRILWATGAMAVHPLPLLERFWSFEIPADLIDGYGYPALTTDIKRKILGSNFARLHGLDVDAIGRRSAADHYGLRQRTGLADPWSAL
jgi:predicted TIM-barrel fold metal-dependent hydrolase